MIKSLVEKYGVKNLRVFLPMSPLEFAGFIPGIAFKSSSTPKQIVECEIIESRYKVSNNHKVEFKAVDPIFGKESWYIMDFDKVLEDHSDVRVYQLNSDGYFPA